MDTRYEFVDSPVGELLIAATPSGLTHLLFAREGAEQHATHAIDVRWPLRASAAPRSPESSEADRWLDVTREQLAEYFAGTRQSFALPLHVTGTDFQRAVWHALTRIPYAATRSYGELAQQIERPRAVRAVGLANGRNPISIVVPCHRVIGANGSLTGYGGGLDRKRWLLALETRHA